MQANLGIHCQHMPKDKFLHCIAHIVLFQIIFCPVMAVPQTDLFTFGPFGKKPLKEQVTPHKISLVVLIQEYCSLKEDDSTRPEPLSFGNDKPTPKITEREKRNFMVTILQLLQVCFVGLMDTPGRFSCHFLQGRQLL